MTRRVLESFNGSKATALVKLFIIVEPFTLADVVEMKGPM